MTQKLNFRIISATLPVKRPGNAGVLIGSFIKPVLRGLFSRLARRRLKKIKAGVTTVEWRPLNNRLSVPLAVPYLMVNAPRWNTHASVLTAGPFSHEGGDLTFGGLPEGCCKSWALVFYDAITGETVDFLSSGTRAGTLTLPIGTYGCGLRIYEPDTVIKIPEIRGKDSALVPACAFDPTTETDLRSQIFDRTSWFYRSLNAPVSRMLAAVKDEIEPRLAKSYLPVGNPETLFIFGPIPQSGKLVIGAETLPDRTLCYLTAYNSASFPTLSIKIEPGGSQDIPAAPGGGSFLMRLIPVRGSAAESPELLHAVTVQSVPTSG